MGSMMWNHPGVCVFVIFFDNRNGFGSVSMTWMLKMSSATVHNRCYLCHSCHGQVDFFEYLTHRFLPLKSTKHACTQVCVHTHRHTHACTHKSNMQCTCTRRHLKSDSLRWHIWNYGLWESLFLSPGAENQECPNPTSWTNLARQSYRVAACGGHWSGLSGALRTR